MDSTAILLLAKWSVTTTPAEKFQYRNNQPYKDTPRSRWETKRVAVEKLAVRR
jgi:hypothetical protein